MRSLRRVLFGATFSGGAQSPSRRRGRLAGALAAAMAIGLIAVPAASAAYQEVGTIGSSAIADSPLGVAVDETNDYVYVAAVGSQWTVRLDLDGTPVGSPFNTGSPNNAVAVDQGSGNVYALSIGEGGIDPSTISLFDSSGSPVGTPFSSEVFNAGSFNKIAVDVDGDVYVPGSFLSNGVVRLSSTGTPGDMITGSGDNTLEKARGVDVDDEGNVYVVDKTEISPPVGGRAQVFDSNGDFVAKIAEADASDSFLSIAVNRGNGDVFVLEDEDVEGDAIAHIVAYERVGDEYVQYDDFGAGDFAPVTTFGERPQLTVDSRDGTVYATDPQNDVVHVYANPQPPIAVTGGASAISQTTATLEGEVNPNGTEVTECSFAYGVAGGPLDQSADCKQTVGDGEGLIDVSADVSGLSADTEYEFQLSAESSAGEDEGDVEEFSTLPNKPTLSGVSGSASGQSAATLHATVNANGSDATCVFHWGTSTAYGNQVACSTSPVTGSTDVAVQAALSGLSAGTTYHFKVVATNGGGASEATGSFTTEAAPVTPTTPTTPVTPVTPATNNGKARSACVGKAKKAAKRSIKAANKKTAKAKGKKAKAKARKRAAKAKKQANKKKSTAVKKCRARFPRA